MTISYNAGSNLITLDDSAGAGDSWGTAYDMDDVLAACGAVVTKQGANAFDVSARMLFASGVYFKSVAEFVELKPNPASCAYSFHIASGAHVRFGEYNSTDKFSYNGSFWRMYIASTTGTQNGGNLVWGEFLVYGSNIWTDVTTFSRGLHYKAGSTVKMYNSIIRAKSYFWTVDHDLQDVKWFGTGAGTYDMLVASGFNFNWAGLTTMDCNYGLFFSGTTTSDVDLYDALILDSGSYDIFISSGCPWLIRVINPVVHPISIAGTGSGKQGVQICYTFNVKVTNGTNPIVGATVELKDKNNDVVFSEQTVSGGVLTADKIVKVDWYRHSNQGGHLTYNDHTLKVTNGADETEYKVIVDHQISEDIILLPQSTASYDNIMAGIDDMKGTGFVKDTHSMPQTLTAVGFSTENPPSQVLSDYKATGFAPAGEYDTEITSIEIIKKLTGNKLTASGDIITIYEDNGVDVWKQYNLIDDGREEV